MSTRTRVGVFFVRLINSNDPKRSCALCNFHFLQLRLHPKFGSEMAGECNSWRIGMSGLGSSSLREKREAHLSLTDTANVALLSAPNFVITTGFLDSYTLAIHPALWLDL